MRKLSLIGKSILFLLFFYQIQVVSAQEFGKTLFRECWHLLNENISSATSTNASDNDFKIYTAFTDGIVEALDHLGKSVWRSEVGGTIVTPIISDLKTIYVVSQNVPPENNKNEDFTKLTVRALSTETGVTNWQQSIQIINGEKTYLLSDPEKLYLIVETGSIYVLEKTTGHVEKKAKLNFKITLPPSLLDKRMYLGTSEKKVAIVKMENLEIENEVAIKNTPTSLLAVNDEDLYVGDSNGNIQSINSRRNNTRWKTWTGAEITSITKVPKGLLVASFDNYIYFVSDKNGKRVWKKRLSGRSIERPLIKDNVAVLSTFGGTDTVLIDISKGKQVNQILIQDGNYFTRNPIGSNGIIIFSTSQGLYVFGSEESCKSSEDERNLK